MTAVQTSYPLQGWLVVVQCLTSPLCISYLNSDCWIEMKPVTILILTAGTCRSYFQEFWQGCRCDIFVGPTCTCSWQFPFDFFCLRWYFPQERVFARSARSIPLVYHRSACRIAAPCQHLPVTCKQVCHSVLDLREEARQQLRNATSASG